MAVPEVVQQKLESLPAKPGVYLFKDKRDAVIYVGKAKSLRSRVRSYFQSGGSDERVQLPFLQRSIGDLETVVTGSEKEAAILEASLVKQHQPRFNVKLRDDKNFISLRLNLDHPWSRLEVARSLGRGVAAVPADDGRARYFGPYHSATAARRALGLVNKHFQLRTCSDLELTSRKRPCLQYQIKRCPAPCVFDVDKAWYADQVRAVAMFLDGRHDELSRELVAKMKEAASDARFELAAVYRDQLRAIESVREEQRIVTEDLADRDVVGFYREGDLAEIAILHIREGRLADVTTYSLKNAELPDEELIGGFLSERYGERTDIPKEIVVPLLPEGAHGFAEWMSDRVGRKVKVVVPKRRAVGRRPRARTPDAMRVDLLELARDNARHAFIEKSRTTDDVQERLAQLQERLRLPTLPRRIECCDISHLGGGDVVGAVVAMQDGQLDKKRYRTFNVKGGIHRGGAADQVTMNDDYAAIYEVLARRFRRGARAQQDALAERAIVDEAGDGVKPASGDGAGEWDLPDLFVVDGGRGQLGVAIAAARDLGLHNLPIVALAKERDLFPPKPKLVKKVDASAEGGTSQATGVDASAEGGTSQATGVDASAEGGTSQATFVEPAKPEPESEPVESHTPTDEAPQQVTADGSAAGETSQTKDADASAEGGTSPTTIVDRVYLPGQKNPIPLKSHSASLFFLARLRDEAHRFSNRARERLGKSRRFKSALDDLPGIGPALKRSLLTTLGSVAAIRTASDEDLLKVPGVRAKHLEVLRRLRA